MDNDSKLETLLAVPVEPDSSARRQESVGDGSPVHRRIVAPKAGLGKGRRWRPAVQPNAGNRRFDPATAVVYA